MVFVTQKGGSLDINKRSNNSMLEMWRDISTGAFIVEPHRFSCKKIEKLQKISGTKLM